MGCRHPRVHAGSGLRAVIALVLAAALMGPPDPPDPRIVARLEEIRKVADGTLLDATIIAPGVSFDLWTTSHCLEQNRACYEQNPLGSTAEKRIALKAAAFPMEIGACYVLRRTGHHNWARGLAIGLTVFHAVIGVHNLNQGR